ncbi:thiamine ABC transporter substrate-binding protein [soil metagenome]
MTTTIRMRPRRSARTSAVLAASALALTACSVIGGGDDAGTSTGGASSTTSDQAGGKVVLVTHDSFAVDKKLMADFEQESGLTVQTRAPGDAGTLVNQLVLTKDSPLGDAVFGIDNSFASRALEADVLQPYASPEASDRADELAVDDSDRLTAVDYGDVCINVDRTWFAERDIPEPQTLEDLTDPAYEDLLVVTNPATSSPGLSFLLATVGAFGEDGWRDYWAALRDNGVKVSDGWSDAYFVDFSGSQGKGPRPIVLSYASSPPAEASPKADQAPTRALLDTCFRQVEYAGVIAGAENPEGAQRLIDFMLSTRFQESIPEKMYMYPVNEKADLPAAWARFGPLSDDPFEVSADEIDANRREWIEQWTDTVVG